MRLRVRYATWRLETWATTLFGGAGQPVVRRLPVGRFACLAVFLTAAPSLGGELEFNAESGAGRTARADTPAQGWQSSLTRDGRAAPNPGGNGPDREFSIRSVAGRTDVVDGIPAVDATLFGPCAAAVDVVGRVYVADSRNHRIRLVDSIGTISTVAGTGDWGYGGDGGPATQARLSFPCGLAVDAAGNVFVADVENHRVRRIDAVTGVISTYAGTGEPGFAGDGGLAAGARLSHPTGLAVDDAGALFIADFGNGRVRMVEPATRTITTLRGKRPWFQSADGRPAPPDRFAAWGVAVDTAGYLYATDPTQRLVSRLDLATKTLEILAISIDRGFERYGGPSTWARFLAPSGVAVDSSGDVYIADPLGGSVHRIDGGTGAITSPYLPSRGRFARRGSPAAQTWFLSPQGVAVSNNGHLYIVDSGDHRVRNVDLASQEVSTLAGTGTWNAGWGGGPAAGARFARPESLAIDGDGNVYLIDSNRVWRLDRLTGVVTAFAGTGQQGYSGDGALAINAELRSPRGLATDLQGNVYVGECGRVRRVDTEGVITTIAGTGTRDGRFVLLEGRVPALEAHLNCVERLATDGRGNLYLVESENEMPLPYVLRIDATGTIDLFAGQLWPIPGWNGMPSFIVRISAPSDLAADASGKVYVADPGNSRILRIDAAARSVETILHTKGFRPETVAIDATGSVYVGGGNRIRLIGEQGAVAVLAGNGRGGFSGDGEPAGGAGLSVSGIAIDQFGAVWFTDPNSRRVRVLEPWHEQAEAF